MTKMEILKKEYKKLASKYKLPSFEDLDKDFEIRTIDLERDGHLLNSILKKVTNEINNHLSLLNLIVNPNPNSIYSVILLNKLNEKAKDEMTSSHHKLIIKYYEGLRALLDTDKSKADHIKNIYKGFSEIKKKTIDHLSSFSEVWEKELEEYNQTDKKKLHLG